MALANLEDMWGCPKGKSAAPTAHSALAVVAVRPDRHREEGKITLADCGNGAPGDKTEGDALVEAALQCALEIIREARGMRHDPSAAPSLHRFEAGRRLYDLLSGYLEVLDRHRDYIGRPVRLRRTSPDWDAFADRDGVLGTTTEYTPYCVGIRFDAPVSFPTPDAGEAGSGRDLTITGWTIIGDDQTDSISLFLRDFEPVDR